MESRRIYVRDTKQLETDIQRLHESLDIMTKKYSMSQKQIEEHIQSAAELVDLCKCNADRYYPLISNEINLSKESLSLNSNIQIKSQNLSVLVPGPTSASPQTIHKPNVTKLVRKTVMYSDKLGQGLGLLMNANLNHSMTNFCTPGQSFNAIVNNISQDSLKSSTNVIVLCGDSSHTKKRDIINNFNILTKLQSGTNCKLIVSAFPYCTNLTWEQNKRIYDLNLLLYNLICRRGDTFSYFDINKFINNFSLTSDTMYLSKKCRTQIANLLAFNIHDTVIGGITKSFYDNNLIISSSTNATFTTSNKVTTSGLN